MARYHARARRYLMVLGRNDYMMQLHDGMIIWVGDSGEVGLLIMVTLIGVHEGGSGGSGDPPSDSKLGDTRRT